MSLAPPTITGCFAFNHSMLHVKDPKILLDFHTRVLDMRVLRELDLAGLKFSLYFLKVGSSAKSAPADAGERNASMFAQTGILELTHNWVTKDDADFKYHNDNAQPQGFGQICFSVPDPTAALAWFDLNEVAFIKQPEQGKMKDVAFIQDPDGYWIEIVGADRMKKLDMPVS